MRLFKEEKHAVFHNATIQSDTETSAGVKGSHWETGLQGAELQVVTEQR